MRIAIVVALLVLLVVPATADVWQMKQRDMYNTGQGDWSVATDPGSVFGAILWQKPSAGGVHATQMPFYDEAYGGLDIVVGSYYWGPKGVQGMNRHTGALLWHVDVTGANDISRYYTPAFSNDGSVVYQVIGNATDPLWAWYTTTPTTTWSNLNDTAPDHLKGPSPKIAPDGRIVLDKRDAYDNVYAGTDYGPGATPPARIQETWAGDPACVNRQGQSYALYQYYDSGKQRDVLMVVGALGDNVIGAWDANDPGTPNQLWQTNLGLDCNAETPTIDPSNGNIYAVATQSYRGQSPGPIYVVGVDKDGSGLWANTSMLIDDTQYVWDPDAAGGEGADVYGTVVGAYAGCLSHDGGTYYLQTLGTGTEIGSTGVSFYGRLYAVDTSDGSLKWSYDTSAYGGHSSKDTSCPIVTENEVVIIGDNKAGGTYYAIKDDGTVGTLVDTCVVDATGKATASASLASDGKLYLPMKTNWTVGNGDPDTPDGAVWDLFTCFQTTTLTVPGDVDGNGVVDGLDLTAVLSAWETIPGDPLWNPAADLDGNDVINGLDLTEVISNWTMAAAAPAASASATEAVKPDERGAGRGNVHKGRSNVRRK